MTGDQKDEMESVMATMSYSFEVGEPAVPLEHPRYSKYKNYGTEVQRQKKRRSEWLELQREWELLPILCSLQEVYLGVDLLSLRRAV